MTQVSPNLQPPTSNLKLRIGYVIWSLGLGGAEQVVIRLAKAMAQRGHEVSVLTLNEPGAFARELQAVGIPVISVGKRGAFDVSVIARLAEAFRRRRLDIVHTHLWGANLWGRLAARRARVPAVVITEHNIDTWKRWYHVAIDRWLVRRAAHFIAVSHDVRQFYEARGVAPGRWHVVHNGIDVSTALPRERGTAYRALGIGEAERVVAMIGRLVPAKAPALFLEAVAKAARSIPSLKALVIGDGPLRQAAQAQAQRLGLGDRVIFTGLRDDVPALLAGMDVLVFASEREGLSMAMLEAMAAGVPIVATRVGGTPELIESGVTGALVPSGDARALADRLVELLQHPAHAEAIRNAARRRVEERFSLRAMVDAHESLYASDFSRSDEPTSRRADEPIKICYVIDHLGLGGAQRQLVELATHLPRDCWEPVVISLSDTQRLLEPELLQAGVTVHVIRQHGAIDLRCLRRLVQLLRAHRPAIVHTFLFTADTYGRIAARLAGVRRVIVAIRNTTHDRPWHHRLVNRWLTRWTSVVTVNAEAIRQDLIREGGLPEANLRTIYNGVDLSAPAAGHLNGFYRREWGIPDSARIVAMIARMAPQKDHRTLLEAARRVMAAAPDVYFVLVGDGPWRCEVQGWIDELGVTGRTRMLGERRDVRELLHQIDALVLATHFEGCSNVILEAMAAGKPVIATAVGGNPELVDPEATGLLVPPEDPERLAQAILQVAGDPQRAQAMGRRGRQRIEQRFSVERMVRETAALYADVCERGRALSKSRRRVIAEPGPPPPARSCRSPQAAAVQPPGSEDGRRGGAAAGPAPRGFSTEQRGRS